VPRTGSSAEDDGRTLSMWYDPAFERSEPLILLRTRLFRRSRRGSEAESQGSLRLSWQLGTREGLAYIMIRAAVSTSQ